MIPDTRYFCVPAISAWHPCSAWRAGYPVQPRDTVQPVPGMHPVHTGLPWQPVPPVKSLQPGDAALALGPTWPRHPLGPPVAPASLHPHGPRLSPEALGALDARVARKSRQAGLTRGAVLLSGGAEILDGLDLRGTRLCKQLKVVESY